MTEGSIARATVKGVSKRFGRQRALRNISLTLEKSRVVVLVGPNGAGKSTLLGILSTLVRPTSGELSFETEDGNQLTGPLLRRQIGILSHETLLYPGLNALENLKFFGTLYGVEKLGEKLRTLLKTVGLEEDAWDRSVGDYSRGMVQRLSLARALLHDPRVLLLDEPFTGLDRKGMESLSSSIAASKDAGRLQIIVTHDFLPLDGLADHLVVLRRGQIAHEEKNDAGLSADELRTLYHQHTD